jgi:hypothetical protein
VHTTTIFIYNLRIYSEKTTALNETVDPELLSSMRDGTAGQLEGVPKRLTQENDSIPKIAPKWLKYDRQVSLNLQFALVIMIAGIESAIVASTFFSFNYI